MKTEIQFQIPCFERELVVIVANKSDIDKAYNIMNKAYDDWCEGLEVCGDMCCEEYIISCLREAGIELRGE